MQLLDLMTPVQVTVCRSFPSLESENPDPWGGWEIRHWIQLLKISLQLLF